MAQKNGRLKYSTVQIRTGITLFVAIAIAFFAMSSASLAQVSDYTISPENPQPGATVVISGEADPNEVVTFYIAFEDGTTVTSNGDYNYLIEDMIIPEGSEHFSVSAENVNDLGIKIKIPYTGIYAPVPGKHISISNGVASFGTSTIPEFGAYDIVLSGTAPGDEVAISFTARGIITANSAGDFEYVYDTGNMPEGEYTITIGGISKIISLDYSTPASSSGKKGSSNTGTEFKIVPADSLGKEDDGTGEDAISESDGSLASTQDSVESTDDAEYVEGSKMEQQTPAESTIFPDLKIIGVIIAAFGLIALGAIMYVKKVQ